MAAGWVLRVYLQLNEQVDGLKCAASLLYFTGVGDLGADGWHCNASNEDVASNEKKLADWSRRSLTVLSAAARGARRVAPGKSH